MASGLAAPLVLAVGGGLVSAFFYLAVLLGGFGALILGYLAPLPLFLVGLWLGAPTAVIAGLTGGAAVLLGTSGSLLVSVAYLLTGALPVVLVVRQSLLARVGGSGDLEWYPPGRVLLGLVGMGVAAVLVAMSLALDQPGGLEGVVRRMLAQLAEPLFSAQGLAAPGPEAVWMASALPGLVVISWIVMTVINAALAQGALMRFGRNRRPPMRMGALELPVWLLPVFAVSLAAALTLPDSFGFLGINLALILALPFAFAGLSVVHHVVSLRKTARAPLLVGFYMVLFLFGWPILLLVGLGMIEQWIGLRRRFDRAAPGQEDE
ncbi:DUF2232 domain-containing protein [Azospirillum griseum]|uniref:DUF2232 domain-containing protein n=1 Tax=Azospirillum griseum TaxID=2496639 RepID=A0A3S0JJC8_9PROT|nr:DUF2232 domain-containing protein [Azospirillum griseum]RTR21423.1 DUF2232 domain-containing protein [Azospirillum griseum]